MSEVSQEYLQNTFGLGGKVALITGAREGIGQATAAAFARAGAKLAITSRSISRLESVVTELEALGAEVLPLALELRDLDNVREVVAATGRHFGRLDILVNNAGIALRSPSLNYSEAEWAEVMEVNLRGSFFASQAAARIMSARGGGKIVNLSSIFAHLAMGSRAAYAASKAGLEQMTKVLAVEWAPYSIQVNCVAPATVMTPTRAHLFPTPEALQKRLDMIPLGRLGVPDDVAPTVLFLASPASSWITGATLMVDGGMSLP